MAKQEWLYGVHAVQAVLDLHPERVLELWLQSDRREELAASASKLGISVQYQQKSKFQQRFEDCNHQGVVARCRPLPIKSDNELNDLLDQLENKNGHQIRLLVLDTVTDPHNLGSCLRSSDALGVDAVIAPKDKSVGLTPVVAKTASGAMESVPFFQVTNLARCLEQLKQRNIWVLGTAISEQAVSVRDFTIEGHWALVMGAEGKGLRSLTAKTCDQLLYLPMRGYVDSLNVSVAAGVFVSMLG